MRSFLVAVQFLTRLPVPPVLNWRDDELARALPAFGVVGALVGAAIGFAYLALVAVGIDSLSAAVVATSFVGPLLTGALHEDGLGDVVDGMFGGRDRASALRIFRDSRVGAYGVVAICGALMLRGSLLSGLDGQEAVAVLMFAHCIARASTVVLMAGLPYARTEEAGVGEKLAEGLRLHHSVGVGGVAVAATAGAVGWLGVLGPVWAVVSAAVVVWVLFRWFHRRLGGVTGDGLGATCVLVELVVLALAPLG